MKFKLVSPFQPAGDQPQAIEKLTRLFSRGEKKLVLLGVTGSGKTFTVAKVIENLQKPTLVISHNKTLAAQLYQEFREFFPQNAVCYFVSYYDYYQPEAYIPQTDTYIGKDTAINEEIDRLRLQATSALFSRSDVLIVASVSCIYNIGSPLEYGRYVLELKKGEEGNVYDLASRLVALHYQRSRLELTRGSFRLRGEVLEIYPAYEERIIRVVTSLGKIKEIFSTDLFGNNPLALDSYLVYPAKHYMTNPDNQEEVFRQIREDLRLRVEELEKEGKFLEARRLEQRTEYDLTMIAETGYVNGIENYSRYFDGRAPGEPPYTLVDYFWHRFGDDFLIVIDESHITIPQLRGMYRGDLARKKTLIEFGFRLPSCLDNRPLKFKEFWQRVPRVLFVSATPDKWEISQAKGKVIEQIIRPTGLVDPEVEVRPTKGQIQNLIEEIIARKKKGERVLVTTLTKRTAEDLAAYLSDEEKTSVPLAVAYLHSDIETLKRTEILEKLRKGEYDVIVGINLLREGLDLPEVSLVAILDADKQGFLRSRTSLIQTMGRAARNAAGKVILYADEKTEAMREALREVERRRKIQLEYNRVHGIVPQTIKKPIRQRLVEDKKEEEIDIEGLTPGEKKKLIARLRRQMRQAARELDFEKAIKLRDMIKKLET
ncbi:excinuclease ABC subunit UvrB [bacterium]|nr:excinuclease ABC subunit UvrB [bacterium]